jgi:hypothetical protein
VKECGELFKLILENSMLEMIVKDFGGISVEDKDRTIFCNTLLASLKEERCKDVPGRVSERFLDINAAKGRWKRYRGIGGGVSSTD